METLDSWIPDTVQRFESLAWVIREPTIPIARSDGSFLLKVKAIILTKHVSTHLTRVSAEQRNDSAAAVS